MNILSWRSNCTPLILSSTPIGFSSDLKLLRDTENTVDTNFNQFNDFNLTIQKVKLCERTDWFDQVWERVLWSRLCLFISPNERALLKLEFLLRWLVMVWEGISIASHTDLVLISNRRINVNRCP